jgi:flagellar basal-body rod protein FlgC
MFPGMSAIEISASGLAAERIRMEVTANNIANANTTITQDGEPFRRKNVVFAALTDPTRETAGGVRVVAIQPDQTPFEIVHNPGHPHADADGNVRLTNVKIPDEMIDLISASRSYEANLRSISLYKEMVEETLSLLRGNR